MNLNLLHERASRHAGCLLTTVEGGAMVRRTFADLARAVDDASRWLAGAGIRARDRVGILSESRYEWLVCDLALARLDAVSVALPEEDAVDCTSLVDALDLQLLLVSPAQAAAGRLPAPCALIDRMHEPAGVRRSAQRAAGQLPDDFSLVYSSGTTGSRKGMIVSKAGSEALIRAFADAFAMGPGDRIVVFMPLSSYQQRLFCFAAVHYGMDLVLVPGPSIFRALRESAPSVIIGPPALFEALEAQARATASMIGDETPAGTSKRLRAMLGGNARVLIMGMAKPNPRLLEAYSAADLPLYEVYGLTECGVATANRPGDRRIGSVGKPLSGTSVRLSGEGEVIVSKEFPLTRGYFATPRGVSSDVFASDGFHTGDLGRFDADGYLYLTGRKSALVTTRAGQKLQPEVLEDAIARCRDVRRAVVLSHDSGIDVVVDTDGGCSPEVEERVRQAVERLNTELPDWCRIQRMTLSEEAFTSQNGLLTRSLKVDRAAVLRRFDPAGQGWTVLRTAGDV